MNFRPMRRQRHHPPDFPDRLGNRQRREWPTSARRELWATVIAGAMAIEARGLATASAVVVANL
jgi:hypothetical protein